MRTGAVVAFLALAASAPASGAAPAIELYTMGPGDELFSKFGHAALCVTASDFPGGGLCYNYGTADFSRPVGLGWEVVRGRAEFWVSVTDRTSMLLDFESQDRSIYRQTLPLERQQVVDVARALARDAAPENRAYIYNHFLENCSTRPRDHIDRATGGALRRVTLPRVGTYRDYATEGFAGATWLLVPASDFLLGRWADRKIDAYAAMFIPEVLRSAVETSLGARPELVYERRRPLLDADVRAARARVLVGCVVLVVFFALALLGAPKALARAARRLAAIVLGGLGLVLLFVALVSPLPELQRHELLLVFFPMDVLLFSRRRAFLSGYSTMRLAALALVAILKAAGVLFQPLWPFWLVAFGIFAAVRGSVGRGGVYSAP
jgi:hypothetical protein